MIPGLMCLRGALSHRPEVPFHLLPGTRIYVHGGIAAMISVFTTTAYLDPGSGQDRQ